MIAALTCALPLPVPTLAADEVSVPEAGGSAEGVVLAEVDGVS
jgi:hypothetical protein